MARWKTVARWFIDRRFQLADLNEETLVVPRAYDKPEFGPCALVAATLLTDWGATFRLSPSYLRLYNPQATIIWNSVY
jgi:hypothetical protein